MKIIFLESAVDAEHNISRFLQAKGVALLFPADLNEAGQLLQLHGKSVDLMILQLENPSIGSKDLTLQFLEKLKADPDQADLPILLTTSTWSDEECARHQASSAGANGYLRSPYSEDDLWSLIQGVVGAEEGNEGLVIPDLSVAEIPVPDLSGQFNIETPDLSPDPQSQSMSLNASVEPKIDRSLSMGEDIEASQEMPYLFTSHKPSPAELKSAAFNPLTFSEPLGDAVVPGGAAQSPDLETLKKYLFLREQDVAALSTQLQAAHDQTNRVEQSLREEKAKNAELNHIVHEQKQKLDQFDKEKAVAFESLQNEINDLRFQVKVKSDKAKVLDGQLRDSTEEMANLKERIRLDIRKIRVREKELENRIELMKKDSEALLASRESKITELKRKLDILEFNMDLLQEQYSREKETSGGLRERIGKVAQMIRVVGGLLDASKGGGSDLEAVAAHLDANDHRQKAS